MSIAEFVSHLRNLDVRLSTEGNRLRVSAPKGVLTDTLRAQIAERKQELLDFLRDNNAAAALNLPTIVRRMGADPTPLSFAQERIWFLEQLEPGNAIYNICRAWRLRGEVNLSALESSLNEIVRRHEVLRSSIRVADSRPVQVIQPPFELNLSVIELHATSDVEREQKIRHRIQQAAEASFDFAAGKFLRAELLRLAEDEQVLILATHHIVSDAWSMGILTRELWSLYEMYAAGKSAQLEELQIQYADFAGWQREWLQGDVLESQLSYWKEQLRELPILNLPTDHPRAVKQNFHGARQSFSLSESLTAAVNELSGREGVTQFMTLLAAFQVLLYRYSRQEDVVVGSPIANRNRTDIERSIGFFVNTLILRSDCSGKPSFREFLSRVRDVCLGAYAHQDLPFEKLVKELRPERDVSRNPLFQVMFVLQNTPRLLPQPTALSIERVDVLPATSLFDLSLYLRERDGKLIGFVEYNTDLFESSTIERMIGHFETLLEGIVADPEQPISTLPLLTEAERHQLLVEWNATEADYPRDSCIHELFEAQVERTPEAIAVQFKGESLTYRELNSRANQLAHYLQQLGVGPEKLVGICVERSMEMVIGLLGILKAGGAYVPLDPSYPRERLAFMLEDSQVSVLLTSERIIEGFKLGDSDSRSSILHPQIKMVCLDVDRETFARESGQNPRSEVKPHNLAYVIYTSGSTGQPKGVAIEHRNTVAFLHWARSIFTPEELRGVLASTSICFDLSIFELFVPLSWGGKAILVENVLQLPCGSGGDQVTLINTVPSAMTELLRINGLPESLRTVNLAGEPLRSDLVEQLYRWGNVNKVYDLYGPSETTTYSTFTLRVSNQPVTIGRPIANTRVYILDGAFQPVPVGVTGEIFIGGAGIARGYLNQSELTAEMFVADPFRRLQRDRLYRTGDRGRYLPDGNIQFIGRMDNQVKIRGYRIELGEIEAVLNQHPAVNDAVVTLREDETEEESIVDNPKSKTCTEQTRSIENLKSLVAYIVSDEEQLKISELRPFLKQKLPEYMIPSSFVVLEELPLLPNGKVDRSRLPPQDGTRPPPTGECASPRTEIEELVAQTWREVLKIDDVGIYDNFFELGGHSLLATQIVARLQEAFNKDVPLRILFDAPTVAELAQELVPFIRDGRAPELPTIVPVPRDGPIPLSMNQEHLWHLDRMIPGTHFFNMPYIYRLSGDLNVSMLEKALQEIVKRHEALRTVFAEIDGCPTQIIKEVAQLEIPNIDLRTESADEVSQKAANLVLEERQGAFNLTVGPLVRIKLLRLTNTDYLLLVTMHHIIGDYWSMQIFRRELAALYETFAQGRPVSLPEPTIQFADFAIWERQLFQLSLLDNQQSYWKKQLVAPLPDSYGLSDRKKTPILQMSHEPVEFDQSLYADIRRLAASENCTPFTVLMGALSVALCADTGNRDVLIATLAANRATTESRCVIGHLMNTLILRLHVSPVNTIKQLLRHVRTQLTEAFTHQQFPFEELARVLESDSKLARKSLCQVLFSYQYRHREVTKFSGLTFAPFELQCLRPDENVALSAFNLILRVTATSTELTGAVNYRTGRLSRARAHRVRDVFIKMLRLIVTTPDDNLRAVLKQV